MRLRERVLGIVCVLLLGVGVAEATLIPIDETGWMVRVAEVFDGKAFLFYDSTDGDDVWIELGYVFEDDVGINRGSGDPVTLEFKLESKAAINYMPNFVIRDITVTNMTGRMWNAFHIQLAANINGTGNVGFDPDFIFDGPIEGFNPLAVTFDASAYQGIDGTPLKMDFGDGILTGDDLFIGFRGSEVNYSRIVTNIDEGDSFMLKVWPEIFIPEPITFVLLSLGTILLLPRRRKLCE